MSETYSKYSGDNRDSSVKVEWVETNKFVMKEELTVNEITDKRNIPLILKAKVEQMEKGKEETGKSISYIKSQLEAKWLDIDKWIQDKCINVEGALNWRTLADMFLVKNQDIVLSCSSLDEIETQFQKWNTDRRNLLPTLLTDDNLYALSFWEQIRRWMATWVSEEEMTKRMQYEIMNRTIRWQIFIYLL